MYQYYQENFSKNDSNILGIYVTHALKNIDIYKT